MHVQQCAAGARAGGHVFTATVPSVFRDPEGRAEERRRMRDAEQAHLSLQLQPAHAGACRLPVCAAN